MFVKKVSLTKVCFQLEQSVAPRTIWDYSQWRTEMEGKVDFFFSMNFSYVHIFAMLFKKGYFHWLFGSTRNKKYGFKEWTAQTWVLITALNPIGTEWLSSRALGAVMTAGSECPNPALMLWPQMKISPNNPNLLPHALTHRQPVPHIHTKGLCQLCHGAK